MSPRGLAVQIRGLSVRYSGRGRSDGAGLLAAQDVDLEAQPGEIVAVVGPSGCGKTTVLNVLAGFLGYEGFVLVGDRPPGRRRDLGYMFQRDTLLPWRTVLANVVFALEVRGVDRRAASEVALPLLTRLGLDTFVSSYPHELSGGMAKRAALAQSLIHEPALVLLDEPFGALDAFTRASVEQDFLRLIEATGSTSIFVTHNLQEAIALSDRVVVMSARPGRVVGDFAIDLPRPRSVLDVQYTPRFAEYEQEIWARLRQQVLAA